jgi:uncharacterized Tic20 family protein
MSAPASPSDKNWALFIHLSTFLTFVVPVLGLFAPILFWIAKRRESEFLDDQGREASNFTLTCFVAGVVLVIGGTVLLLALKGQGLENADPLALAGGGVAYYILFILLGLFWLVGSIMAALKASAGERFRHKFVIRFFRN